MNHDTFDISVEKKFLFEVLDCNIYGYVSILSSVVNLSGLCTSLKLSVLFSQILPKC